jgi:hypothetical protein
MPKRRYESQEPTHEWSQILFPFYHVSYVVGHLRSMTHCWETLCYELLSRFKSHEGPNFVIRA